jgi:hypothetical protein
MAKQKKWAELSPKKQEEIRIAREKKLTEASLRLASGVEALLKENRWKEYLQFSLKFHQYSFINTFLIMLQRPDATCVASFKTWKSMERSVKKGEHGIEIFVPMLIKNQQKEEYQNHKTQIPDESVLEEETTHNRENNLLGFKMGYIFDVSQTEGKPLPERPYARLEGDDNGMFAALKAAIEELLQIPVTFSSLPAPTIGYCKFDPFSETCSYLHTGRLIFGSCFNENCLETRAYTLSAGVTSRGTPGR